MSVDHKGRKVINPFNTHHVIIDLETFALNLRAAIFAVGVVILDPSLKVQFAREYILSDTFNDPTKDSRFGNYEVEQGTVDWWMAPSQEMARHYLEDRGEYDNLGQILDDILYVIKQCPKDNFLVYGDPSAFDIPIITNAFSKLRTPIPWKHNQTACMDTLHRFVSQEDKDSVKFNGIIHTPLADAIHAAKYLVLAMNNIYQGTHALNWD